MTIQKMRVFRKLWQEEYTYLTFNAIRNTKHKKLNTLQKTVHPKQGL